MDKFKERRRLANRADWVVTTLFAVAGVATYIGMSQQTPDQLIISMLASPEHFLPLLSPLGTMILVLAEYVQARVNIPIPETVGVLCAFPFLAFGLLSSLHFTEWLADHLDT